MKKEEKKAPQEEPKKPKMRRIVIETDGNNINLVENEMAGGLELAAVLQTLLAKLAGR